MFSFAIVVTALLVSQANGWTALIIVTVVTHPTEMCVNTVENDSITFDKFILSEQVLFCAATFFRLHLDILS